MANFVYTNGMLKMLTSTASVDIDTASQCKLMLLHTTAAVVTKNETSVFTTLTGKELTATGYTGGYNGGGRHAVTIALSVSANTVEAIFSTNAVWSSLGQTANDTIVGVALIKEVTNDTASIPVAYWDISPTVTTNGSDFTLTVAVSPSGNITFTT